jgi:hypothetical protein
MGPTTAQEMQGNMAEESTNYSQYDTNTAMLRIRPCVINDAISDNMVTGSRIKGGDHKW